MSQTAYTPEQQEVIKAIGARHDEAQPLAIIIVQRKDPTLHQNAVRYFGSWSNAIKAAGFPLNITRKYSENIIL